MIRTLVLATLLTASSTAASQEATPKADPARGKAIAETVCIACHGLDGNSQITMYPHIAGQNQDYLKKQISDFKTGLREDPSMTAMVATVPKEEVANVAAWFARQSFNKPAAPAAETSDEVIARGQQLWRAGDAARGVPACAACHGVSGRGLPAQYPRLAGQFPEYTETQLKNFRLQTRANDPESMMRVIADKLSDNDIKAVSQYAAGLR
jgi:cytochrome c553